MKLHFLTIVLDGMPWITHHLPVFHQLSVPWEWHIVEGVAKPIHCTAWCKPISPRFSNDGTHEYLESLRGHPRVKLYQRPEWNGKVEMVNEPLANITEPGLLIEFDSDEIWTAYQLMVLRQMFIGEPSKNCADFHCRYFVGPNIVVERKPGTWTNQDNIMWRRAWRFQPGMRFERHEPPVIASQPRVPFTHEQTERNGLVFDHYAYVTEQQARFKEEYYGYAGAVESWKRLQENTQWPAKLSEFFSWITDNTTATKLYV